MSLKISFVTVLSVLPVLSYQQREVHTPCASFKGNSLFVNSASGSDSKTCGSSSMPCRTISFAVRRAIYANYSSVVVNISIGIYKELNVISLDCGRLNLKRITFWGERYVTLYQGSSAGAEHRRHHEKNSIAKKSNGMVLTPVHQTVSTKVFPHNFFFNIIADFMAQTFLSRSWRGYILRNNYYALLESQMDDFLCFFKKRDTFCNFLVGGSFSEKLLLLVK